MRDQRRRRWSLAEKAALVRRSYEPGMSVSLIARQGRLDGGRRTHRDRRQRPAAARHRHPDRDRHAPGCAGQDDLEERDLQGSRGVRHRKKVDCALTLAGQGRPMKVVCETLGLARSNVRRLRARSDDWIDARTCRTAQVDNALLLDKIGVQVTDLPIYGYRRTCALVNRQRADAGVPRVNAKSVDRVMASHALLPPEAPQRRQSSRPHEGKATVPEATCGGAGRFRDQARLESNREGDQYAKTAAIGKS